MFYNNSGQIAAALEAHHQALEVRRDVCSSRGKVKLVAWPKYASRSHGCYGPTGGVDGRRQALSWRGQDMSRLDGDAELQAAQRVRAWLDTHED